MGKVMIGGSGGAGADSEELTALKTEVLKGKTAITHDSDGELAEGELEVNSILNFKVSAYDGLVLQATWQNPYAAKGRPYGGVMIEYSTDDYPEIGTGIQIYKGTGNSVEEGGMSTVLLTMPDKNVRYYFIAYPYAGSNMGDLTGEVLKATAATVNPLTEVIKVSGEYIVPDGVYSVDVFGVGGGGGGYNGNAWQGEVNGHMEYVSWGGSGGGGGYTMTVRDVKVEPGQILSITIGTGSRGNGGATLVLIDGTEILKANGGRIGPGNGGSGGGAAAWQKTTYLPGFDVNSTNGGAGGSNGGNGRNVYYDSSQPALKEGAGQGTTTKAFGENTGILYAGGGGGGSCSTAWAYHGGGAGGSGGGGNGGSSQSGPTPGANGTSNTGGGGGGGSAARNEYKTGGSGGSGVVLIRMRGQEEV